MEKKRGGMFHSTRFVGVCYWSFVYLLTLVACLFYPKTNAQAWTFLSASLTPSTTMVWLIYMGVKTWQHIKVPGK